MGNDSSSKDTPPTNQSKDEVYCKNKFPECSTFYDKQYNMTGPHCGAYGPMLTAQIQNCVRRKYPKSKDDEKHGKDFEKEYGNEPLDDATVVLEGLRLDSSHDAQEVGIFNHETMVKQLDPNGNKPQYFTNEEDLIDSLQQNGALDTSIYCDSSFGEAHDANVYGKANVNELDKSPPTFCRHGTCIVGYKKNESGSVEELYIKDSNQPAINHKTGEKMTRNAIPISVKDHPEIIDSTVIPSNGRDKYKSNEEHAEVFDYKMYNADWMEAHEQDPDKKMFKSAEDKKKLVECAEHGMYHSQLYIGGAAGASEPYLHPYSENFWIGGMGSWH